MEVQNLDLELRAKLLYNDSPEGKVSVIYAPGLGSTTGSLKRLKPIQRRLRELGADVNFVTFVYRSHQGEVITGFRNDQRDLAQVVEMLRTNGFSYNQIGLLGICYGAHVISQYISADNQAAFAILVEPYFGLDTLKTPFRQIANAANYARRLGKLPVFPIGRDDEGNPKYVDLNSFATNDGQGIEIKENDIPMLTIITNFHRVFDHEHIRQMRGRNSTIDEIGGKAVTKDTKRRMDESVSKFLARLYNGTQFGINYGLKTPSETSPARLPLQTP